MLLATGFPGGGWGIELAVILFAPFVLAGLVLLAGGWTLISRRGPARWAAVAGLVLPIVWTLFGFMAHREDADRIFGELSQLFGLPVGAVLFGGPLGFAAAYAIGRLLERSPRAPAREVTDSALVAALPALAAWGTFRVLGVLPADPSPALLVDPVLAAFGGLWAATAAWLTWSRLRLLRREEARAERLRHAARPLSVAALSD